MYGHFRHPLMLLGRGGVNLKTGHFLPQYKGNKVTLRMLLTSVLTTDAKKNVEIKLITSKNVKNVTKIKTSVNAGLPMFNSHTYCITCLSMR